MDLNQVIYTVFHVEFESDPKLDQNHPKTRFKKNYDFFGFYDFYIKKGPLGAHVDASTLPFSEFVDTLCMMPALSTLSVLSCR